MPTRHKNSLQTRTFSIIAARNDPTGFVRGFDRVTIDEVQRAPELLRAIKRSVDSDRSSGCFLLTGSANILTLPQVSESLAGRMEIVNLMPISRAEILGKEPTFLKTAFNGKLVKPGPEIVGEQLVHAVLVGGYPEMLRREDSRRRQAWARDYVKAIQYTFQILLWQRRYFSLMEYGFSSCCVDQVASALELITKRSSPPCISSSCRTKVRVNGLPFRMTDFT
jgi:predicted AAA+ superfamily ATPase